MPREIDDVTNPSCAELDDELGIIKSMKPPRMEKVKLEKNESILMRIFPHNFDEHKPDSNKWYARLGIHWVGNRTHYCVKKTAQYLGGNPNAECPFCTLAEKYSQSRTEAVQISARDLAANLEWLMYVFIWEKMIGEERRVFDPPGSYVLHEFNAGHREFEYLIPKYKQRTRKNNPNSFLDPEMGNDFWYSRAQKYSIEIDESSPWAPNESGIEAIYSAAVASIIPPKITFLTGEHLDKVYKEAKENVSNGIITNKWSKKWFDENSSKSAATTSAPSRSSKVPSDEATGFEEQVEESLPARRSPLPQRNPVKATVEEESPRQVPTRRSEPVADMREEEETPFEPVDPVVQKAPAVQALTPPARRVVPAGPPPVAAKTEPEYPKPGDDSPDDEEEGLATEAVDSAPPQKAQVEEAPPKVNATGSPSRPPLQAGVLARLRRNNEGVK